jgi:tRNA threonylcarbamoyladenosine biosynthesis protein TsaB
VKVLAVESATEQAGVALADDDGEIAAATSEPGRRHAEWIAPAIQFVCRQSGVTLEDVDVVAVDVGPGLFTGLRVGVATAKALAFALGRPITVVSSLDALAAAVVAARRDDTVVVPVIDARRGEVYRAGVRGGPGGTRPVWPEQRRTPDELAAELRQLGESFVATGNGARRYASTLDAVAGAVLTGPNFDFPSPAMVARLGLHKARAGDIADPGAVVPHYLRDADTRINWERRERRAAAEV